MQPQQLKPITYRPMPSNLQQLLPDSLQVQLNVCVCAYVSTLVVRLASAAECCCTVTSCICCRTNVRRCSENVRSANFVPVRSSYRAKWLIGCWWPGGRLTVRGGAAYIMHGHTSLCECMDGLCIQASSFIISVVSIIFPTIYCIYCI